MINIQELFKASNGTKEFLEFSLNNQEIKQADLVDEVVVKATLVRVEEGIKFMITKLNCKVKFSCVRCNKDIVVDIQTSDQTWLFYGKKPKDFDDENEFLEIDINKMELDPVKVIRQEILLNSPNSPHCKDECVHFDETSKGSKALAALKDMWENAEE